MSMVLQDVNLFTGTVLDNIRYGKLDATDEECVAAAKLANADGFIRMHIVAAKAVALGEALRPEFGDYQAQILRNAKTLADGLIGHGFKLVTGGTDNHLMLLDLRETGITGKELEQRLDSVRITANKNMI